MSRLDDPSGDYPDDPPEPRYRWWHYALSLAALAAVVLALRWWVAP